MEKLAFIRLNGLPPGLSINRTIYKNTKDCASHFVHIGRNLQATLITVDRSLSSIKALQRFLNWSIYM